MPVDIYDKKGNHIGVIHRNYHGRLKVYMVAITDLCSEDTGIEIDKIKKFLAGTLGCKTLLGKINEDSLERKVTELLEQDKYKKFSSFKYEEFLKLLFLDRYYGEKLEKVVEVNIDPDHIKGYLLFDANKIEVMGNKIILDDEIDYIYQEKIGEGIPIYAKITDWPVITTHIMGAGGILLGADLADLGGRNHRHTTSIKIKSGNFHDRIEFPIMINARKGMDIQVYILENKISKVVCDGVVYRFSFD